MAYPAKNGHRLLWVWISPRSYGWAGADALAESVIGGAPAVQVRGGRTVTLAESVIKQDQPQERGLIPTKAVRCRSNVCLGWPG
jgi:hypothetical protein